MKKTIIGLVSIGVLLIVFFVLQKDSNSIRPGKPKTFSECVSMGYPVMESYPRQCVVGEDRFVEDIGNSLEKESLIRLNEPRPNEEIGKEIVIRGEARGYWYFEASFPIEIKDDNGNIVGSGIAQANGEWMTESFVPFEAKIMLSSKPTTKYGKIILKKDNPSGDPERDDSLIVPIIFATSN